MSITVHQQPEDYSPVYNKLPFVISSSQEAQDNFKFVCRLYNSTALLPGNLLKEWRVPVHPEGGAIFDPSQVIKDYMSFDITGLEQGGLTGFNVANNTFEFYTVQFIEQYGDPETLHSSGVVSGLTVINGAINFRQKATLDINDYLLNLTSVARFLTNSPRELRIREDESYILGYMSDGVETPIKPDHMLVVNTYNEAGTLISTYTINNPLDLDNDYRFNDIYCGPYNLNNATLSTGSQPVITDSVYKYTVGIQDAEGLDNYRSELFTFIIDRACTPYDKYRIYWVNRWGRIDGFTFKGNNRSVTDLNRGSENYSRRPDGFKSGNSYLEPASRHAVYPFFTEYQDKLILETGIITKAEAEWLKELMTSPAVWWAQYEQDRDLYDPPADYFHAVNVKAPASIEPKNRGVINLTFELEFAHKDITQGR